MEVNNSSDFDGIFFLLQMKRKSWWLVICFVTMFSLCFGLLNSYLHSSFWGMPFLIHYPSKEDYLLFFWDELREGKDVCCVCVECVKKHQCVLGSVQSVVLEQKGGWEEDHWGCVVCVWRVCTSQIMGIVIVQHLFPHLYFFFILMRL